MKVKGTLLIDAVKMIRTNPSLEWDKWLEPEDWEFVNRRVLASSWYPWNSFRRILIATFTLIGNSDFAAARFFGKLVISNQLQTYQHVVIPEDPVQSVERLVALRRTFFSDDLGMITNVKEHGEGWIRYEVSITHHEIDRLFIEAEGNFLTGLAEGVIERCGKRIIETTVEFKGNGCEVLLKWE